MHFNNLEKKTLFVNDLNSFISQKKEEEEKWKKN